MIGTERLQGRGTWGLYLSSSNLSFSPAIVELSKASTSDQITYTENLKQIVPETELRGHIHDFHIHVPVSDSYIPMIDLFILLRKYVDGFWEYINRSQTHECRNWDSGRTIPRKGILKWDFLCSVH